jgi:hypothetical protein
MELIIIIVLLAVILIAILIGLIFHHGITPDYTKAKLTKEQWHCEEMVWSNGPKMEDGNFVGRLEMNCDVLGVEGGGLESLKEYLLKESPELGESEEPPLMGTYEGKPGAQFNVKADAEIRGAKAHVEGKMVVSSDENSLHSVNTIDPTKSTGMGKYLKESRNELFVSPFDDTPRWFHVKIATENKVQKPWWVFPGWFKNKLATKLESEMKSREEEMVVTLANHL